MISLEAAKVIGAGLAAIGVGAAAAGVGTVFGSFLQGALRNAHLKYHLSTSALLSAEQSRRYAELRGYTGGHVGAPPGTGHGGHRHR